MCALQYRAWFKYFLHFYSIYQRPLKWCDTESWFIPNYQALRAVWRSFFPSHVTNNTCSRMLRDHKPDCCVQCQFERLSFRRTCGFSAASIVYNTIINIILNNPTIKYVPHLSLNQCLRWRIMAVGWHSDCLFTPNGSATASACLVFLFHFLLHPSDTISLCQALAQF